MKRAFKMKIYNDQKDEYVKRHENVFSELEELFKNAKVKDYTIWHDADTNQLFGYLDVEDDEAWDAIAKTDVCQRWWEHMSDIMFTNSDNSPISVELEKVYEYVGENE